MDGKFKADTEKPVKDRFSRLYESIIYTEPFQNLSYSARFVYQCMMIEASGEITFTFTKRAAEKFGIANSVLRRVIKELESGGFIECDHYRNRDNTYRFSQRWKVKIPVSK